MPVVQVAVAPGRAEYEKVGEFLNIHENRPNGLIHHSAAELPNGEVQIVDVWETRADSEAFGARVFEAFGKAGVLEMVQERGGPPPAYDVFDIL